MGFLSFIPVRIWAGAGLFVVLALGAWKLHHDGYRTGYKAGSAEVQARWDKDVAAREKAWRGVIARQVKITQEVENGLTAKLAAADARGRDLAGRLLRYQRELAAARLAAAAARAPDGSPGEPADGPQAVGGTDGAGTVEAALSDHLAACERDAARLGELQTWVRGVIVRD